MDIRTIVAITAVAAFAVTHIDDYIGNHHTSHDEIAQAQIAILNHTDPTDILAPTSAGESKLPPCKTGFIESGSKTQHLDGLPYIAYKENNTQYIRIMSLLPIHLRQGALQVTTANILEPDTAVTDNLEQIVARRSECEEINLYLAKTRDWH